VRVNLTVLLVILTGALLPTSRCWAAAATLVCTGVGESQHFSLITVPVAHGFDKIVLSDSSEMNREYLVEGIKNIPVGNELALVGSLVSAQVASQQNVLLLEPDSHFEMYRAQNRGEPVGPTDTIFVFDHQNPAMESFDLKTGMRVRDEHGKQGRITLNCEQFPEYLQHVEQLHLVTANGNPVWHEAREKRVQELAADFTSAYIDHDLVFNNHFLGVEIWQNPFDMWVFQQMITELKPDVIIETGTAHGGSALFFAMMLEKLNPVGRVISVEIDPDVNNNISEARSFPVFRNRVSIIKGDSVSSQTLDRIQQAIDDIQRDKNAGRDSSDQQDLVVLVTLDSLHSAEHVLEELRVYSRFVSKGSYIVVQDTVIDSNPKFVDWFVLPWAIGATAGPSLAVQEFLDKNTNFRRDKRWEKFYFTFYPGGFLKKSN